MVSELVVTKSTWTMYVMDDKEGNKTVASTGTYTVTENIVIFSPGNITGKIVGKKLIMTVEGEDDLEFTKK